MPREKLLSSPAYWFEKAQNELFRQFHYYMEREKINQTQLAERLGITKGRVSQILRGESNFTIKTLMELALSINTIPKINYISVADEVKTDELKKVEKKNKSDNVNYLSGLKSGTSTAGDGRMVSNYKDFKPIPLSILEKV